MAPGQDPLYFSPILLKLDIPIVVVLRDPSLRDILAKTEKALCEKADHRSSFPALKVGDHVIFVSRTLDGERLSEELHLTVE